jgi:uncharacterized protein (TIGR00303 family)
MIKIYTKISQGSAWVHNYSGKKAIFACILGFTETCLIPGISAAGLTPEDRKYTALADAEFLYQGTSKKAEYPLPPLTAGASPVFLSRAILENLQIPIYIFNAGLPKKPTIPAIDLQGQWAKCVSTGAAMELATVKHLLEMGLEWGRKLAQEAENGYLILGECVVGGTTTALAVLTGLGIEAAGKVNSSHPICNHEQKWQLVQNGLGKIGIGEQGEKKFTFSSDLISPVSLVAAVGDPMQIVVAGMAITASRRCGVLLAGGTQMLAVYALINSIANALSLDWAPEAIVVGTTRWVAEDPTGETVELAEMIGQLGNTPTLLATQLSFTKSRYPQLQVYEQGFVKEGVGAGGACIASYISHNWQQLELLEAIERQLDQYINIYNPYSAPQ